MNDMEKSAVEEVIYQLKVQLEDSPCVCDGRASIKELREVMK